MVSSIRQEVRSMTRKARKGASGGASCQLTGGIEKGDEELALQTAATKVRVSEHWRKRVDSAYSDSCSVHFVSPSDLPFCCCKCL